jgi:periplasmic copper chaperone A
MRNKFLLSILLTILPAAAMAHVTLTEPQALPGAHYLAHFKVGHGCDGSPTTALSIAIPEGVSGVTPEAKPGWKAELVRDGNRVSAVNFSGGAIAATAPDEFVVAMVLPNTLGPLVFATTQTCEKGTENWAELPAADGHKLQNPAPILTVTKTPANPAPGMDGMDMKGMHM